MTHGYITENEARTRGLAVERIEGLIRYNDTYHLYWIPRKDLPPSIMPTGWSCGVPPTR